MANSAFSWRAFILSTWLILVVLGFWKLYLYANGPGSVALAQPHWPVSSRIPRDSYLPSLVIFLHPRCPCSTATLGELEEMMPFLHHKTNIVVVFYSPKHKDTSWVQSNLWHRAEVIPEAHVIRDEDGVEADKFGAKTSGQVFLYNSMGKLVFDGGITAARGHMGDSYGRSFIMDWAKTGNTNIKQIRTSVYGCSLRNHEHRDNLGLKK